MQSRVCTQPYVYHLSRTPQFCPKLGLFSFMKGGPMPLTAEQIAKKIGISNATVSRVLNNSQNVSIEIREAVLAMVRENGHMPRVLGRRPKRSLDSQPPTSGLVEILMVNRWPIAQLEAEVNSPPDEIPHRLPGSEFFSPQARLSTSFMRHVINGIIDELRHFNLRAVVQVAENLSAPSLLAEVNHPHNRGLFLMGIYDSDVPEFLAQCQCPIVTYMSWNRLGSPDFIGIDNDHGIHAAFEHLRQLGHTKIAYLAGQILHNSAAFYERMAAYKSSLVNADLPYRPEWVVEGSCEYKLMESAAENVLRLPDRPTAFLCCFDGAAVAVKRAADRVGLHVPSDLSIVGFDDADIAQLMTPALTTVRVPTTMMGRHGVHLMLLRQQIPLKPGEGFNIRETPTLIIRHSTAPPTKTVTQLI